MAQPGTQIAAIKLVVKRALVGLLLLVCVVYIVDYLQFRYRVWKNQQPYGTVTVVLVYAIGEKAPPGTTRTEYTTGGTQDQTCVTALFPHSGYTPCWYLRSHSQKQVTI